MMEDIKKPMATTKLQPSDTGYSRASVSIILPLAQYAARRALTGILKSLHSQESAGRPLGQTDNAPPDHSGGPWQLSVHDTSPGAITIAALLTHFTRTRPDFVIGMISEPRLATFLQTRAIPVVHILSHSDAPHGINIQIDDDAIGKTVAEYFIGRGFFNFGVIGDLTRRPERTCATEFQATLAHLSEANRPAAKSAGRSSALLDLGAAAPRGKRPSPIQKIGEWLASLPKPVAIFATTDLGAFLVASAAYCRGILVPDDAVIVGVGDDPSICEFGFPPLSSVHIDYAELGNQAARRATQILAKCKSPGHEATTLAPGPVTTRMSSDSTASAPPHVAAAVRYIRENLGAGVNVKTLLKAMDINRRKLERDFRRSLGHSPSDEIRTVRVAHIKSLLQTELPLRSIALSSGFSSTQYLSTFFLAATGMTPRAFRARNKPRHGQMVLDA